MNLVEQALKIAIMAHEGDKDYNGNPTILHPLTVGFSGQNEDEMVVGFLHDVIEDNPDVEQFLSIAHFPQHIVDAVKLLTRPKDMEYDAYLQRILRSGNEVALNVKMNDLRHNIKRSRAGGHMTQVAKHERALRILTGGE